jgi:GT2 family glycosyltransferase
VNNYWASIVIPTRNRLEDLRKLLCSLYHQTVSVEILVMDDGSSEVTSEMLRNEFPAVRYYRLAEGRGPAFQRNRGIELATQPIVFPFDDDTLLPSSETISQTLAEFDHPRVAAIGIPFINVRQDRVVQQRVSEPGIHVCHSFVGAAHAVRRDVFLTVGGYREHFFYMGEEGDFCLRMMQAGYVTRLGKADPIYHLESPSRNSALADFYGRRNDVLFAWHNVPMPYLPVHLLATSVSGLIFGIKIGHPWRMLRGLASGYASCLKYSKARRPICREIYALHRELKKLGPCDLKGIEGRLPPIIHRQIPDAASQVFSLS